MAYYLFALYVTFPNMFSTRSTLKPASSSALFHIYTLKIPDGVGF